MEWEEHSRKGSREHCETRHSGLYSSPHGPCLTLIYCQREEVPMPQRYTAGLLLCGDSEYHVARYHLEKGQHAIVSGTHREADKRPSSSLGSQRDVQTLATWGQGESTYNVVPPTPTPRKMGCSEKHQI